MQVVTKKYCVLEYAATQLLPSASGLQVRSQASFSVLQQVMAGSRVPNKFLNHLFSSEISYHEQSNDANGHCPK